MRKLRIHRHSGIQAANKSDKGKAEIVRFGEVFEVENKDADKLLKREWRGRPLFEEIATKADDKKAGSK